MCQIYSLIGPTASGKSALAQKMVKHLLAKKAKITLISLDSRQIYQDLPILSGADLEIWQEFKNHITIYNLADKKITTSWSLGLVITQMQNILSKQTSLDFIILVGGTLLYHQRILEHNNLTQIPPNKNIRLVAQSLSLKELQAWLARVNPQTWQKLNHSDAHNPRRLIRKIEIALALDLPIEINKKLTQNQHFFMLPDYQEGKLPDKIKKRVLKRWHGGAIMEVKKILQTYPDLCQQKSFSEKMPLGFKEIKAYLQQELSSTQAIQKWQTKEIQYAKRQKTFLKQLIRANPNLIDQREFFSN